MGLYRRFYQLLRLLQPREWLSLRYARELARNQWLSPEELQNISWQKLKKLLEHAYTNVPFYHERFMQMGITPADIRTPEDFHHIPTLNKDDIRLHEDALIARNYDKNRMHHDTTSGSTGVPIGIYHDHHYVPMENAAFLRLRRWFDVEPGDKIVWVWGRRDDIPPDTWLKRLLTFVKRERWFNAFRVSDEDMQRLAVMLVDWQPDCLAGYATSLYFFARYVSSHHITGIEPKAVETTAGMLWPHERKTIEETFGCKVFDRYGSHETGHIAAECDHHRMHISSDVCHVEVMARGQPAAEGEVGELVVTPLYNYGMPLIRYRVGDVGAWDSQPCPCGRGLPVLRELVGRTNSIITLPSGRYFYGGIFLTILENILEIRQFRVHQPTRDKLEITLAKGEGFSQEIVDVVRKRTVELLANEPVTVSIVVTDEILPTASGKYLVTTSDVPLSFEGGLVM